jgi:hypothetical protein
MCMVENLVLIGGWIFCSGVSAQTNLSMREHPTEANRY